LPAPPGPLRAKPAPWRGIRAQRVTGVRRLDRIRRMDSAAAELSSVSSALDELTRRVTAIAEGYQAARREDLASDLFSVEGLLDTARRRLDKLVTLGTWLVSLPAYSPVPKR
jgi:hypothetical protein